MPQSFTTDAGPPPARITMPSANETLMRQWSMLRKLPRYPLKVTARELKERLAGEGYEISKRTIERDLIELSATFPLMLDDRERPYGWSWQKDAPAFDLPGLGDHESLMLMMVEQHFQAMLPAATLEVMAPYFKAARMKLSGTTHGSKTKKWTEKIRSVPPMQPLLSPKTDTDVQRTVSEALLSEKQLQISYRKRGEKKSIEYRIHPLALVQRGPVFYLSARIFDYEDIRLLALHRIVEVHLLDDPVAAPPGFNLDTEVNKGRFGFGNGNMLGFEAIFSATHGEHLFETPLSRDQAIKELEDGRLHVTATVADTAELRWWLLALGDGVEVIAPSELRAQLASTINSMAGIYKSSP